MKPLILGLALGAAAIAAAPAAMAQNVSISVGQPGFYGALNIGDFAGPPVLYAPQPVIIERRPDYIAEPIYLRVPPPHRLHWARYCGRYGACGRPVLFVQDRWYTNTYVPRYREYYGPRYGGPVRVIERGPYGHPGWHGGPGRHEGWDHGPRGGWDRGPHGVWDRGQHGGWEHGGGHGGGPGRGEDHHGEGHGHR